MKASVTNLSKAEQGVWTEDGLAFIAPGKAQVLVIAADYVERARSLPFLKVEPVIDEPKAKAPAQVLAPPPVSPAPKRGRKPTAKE